MSHSGFIAIVGRPNAGKSTLLNAILGAELSIVSSKAQTTRERVLGILTEEDRQMVFIDTPGIHQAKPGGINECMVNEAAQALEGTTAVWYLVDPNSALEHELAVLELLKPCKSPVLLLFNKVDRLGREGKLGLSVLEEGLKAKILELGIPLHSVQRISALKELGLKALLEETGRLLPEGPHYYEDKDQLSDRPTRFFVAEKIREQLFLQLGDELPYSCAVEIEKFEEPKKGSDLTRIEAVIHVERDSQKGMVIGKGGLKIKSIGQKARIEIERFLGGKVFLGLRVKVLKDWTKDAESLKRMGYHLPESA